MRVKTLEELLRKLEEVREAERWYRKLAEAGDGWVILALAIFLA